LDYLSWELDSGLGRDAVLRGEVHTGYTLGAVPIVPDCGMM